MHVEGDELVYDAVTCASCGAKIREDRPVCFRCGKALVAANAESSRLPLGTFAMVVFGLALMGVGAMLAGGSPGDARTAAAAPAGDRTVPTAGRDELPASADDDFVSRAPVIVALDNRVNGVAAYNRGDLATALDEFRSAVDAHPEDVEALNNLAQVLVRSGRAKDAIPYFDRAIAIASDRWAYHFNRARAYADLQDWTHAIAGYREATRLFPGDYVTRFNLGRALQASGDTAGAVEELTRTVELAPGEPDFRLALAAALDAARRPADAAATYRGYLDLHPDTPQTEKIKARIALLEGPASPRP